MPRLLRAWVWSSGFGHLQLLLVGSGLLVRHRLSGNQDIDGRSCRESPLSSKAIQAALTRGEMGDKSRRLITPLRSVWLSRQTNRRTAGAFSSVARRRADRSRNWTCGARQLSTEAVRLAPSTRESEASDIVLAQFYQRLFRSPVSPGFVNDLCADRRLASTLLPHHTKSLRE